MTYESLLKLMSRTGPNTDSERTPYEIYFSCSTVSRFPFLCVLLLLVKIAGEAFVFRKQSVSFKDKAQLGLLGQGTAF